MKPRRPIETHAANRGHRTVNEDRLEAREIETTPIKECGLYPAAVLPEMWRIHFLFKKATDRFVVGGSEVPKTNSSSTENRSSVRPGKDLLRTYRVLVVNLYTQ